MGSERRSKGFLTCLAMVTIMVLFGFTKADVNKDKEQCGSKLVGLATCLPYVGGEAKFPSKDCCTGIKGVLTMSKVCLCILIKDHNDPSLKLKINDTLALGLPDACHINGNITECVGLLHLQPGSPDAKLFEDYEKALTSKSKNATIVHQPEGDTPVAESRSSDGGRKNTWFGLEIVGLLFITVMLHFHVSNNIVK